MVGGNGHSTAFNTSRARSSKKFDGWPARYPDEGERPVQVQPFEKKLRIPESHAEPVRDTHSISKNEPRELTLTGSVAHLRSSR